MIMVPKPAKVQEVTKEDLTSKLQLPQKGSSIRDISLKEGIKIEGTAKDAIKDDSASRKKSIKDATAAIIAPLEEATLQIDGSREVDSPLLQLQKKVEAQENEVAKLREMLELLVTAETQNVREAKILELFKKNFSLNKSVDRERHLSSRLKGDIKSIQDELIRLKEEAAALVASFPSDMLLEEQNHETLKWKEKFNQVNTKLMETQGEKVVLSAEVNKLQNALQREVGDTPIAKILEEGTGWTGRSEQIIILKGKINDLKTKVCQSAARDYQQHQFEACEEVRKRNFEDLANGFLETKEALHIIKQKLDGATARKRILDSELKNAKEKMTVLVQKNNNDDSLISALRHEIEVCKQAADPLQLAKRIPCPLQTGSLHREHRLAASFNDLKKHCSQQELQIKAQADLISYLQDITLNLLDKEDANEDLQNEAKNDATDGG